MKNISKILFAFVCVLAISCTGDDVENRPVLLSISTPEMVTPQNDKEFVLVEENKDQDADSFVWSAAKYSNNVVVQYTLLMDVKGGDFTAAQVLATTSNGTEVSITVKKLNDAVTLLGGVAGELGSYDVKVMSSVASAEKMISAIPLTILVNAYEPAVANNCPNQFAVGAGIVSAGWGWNSPLTLICNDNVLVAAVNVANDTFRFFTTNGDWGSGRNYLYYVDQGYKISSNLENANDGDSNFKFNGNPGMYRIKIDQNAKTFTLSQGETAANSYWLVGEATPGGWSWSGNSETELGLIKDGVYEVPLTLKSGAAFRVFLGNDGTDDGNWGTSNNFTFYSNSGYTISPELENAGDGDSNFKYTGTTGVRIFKINTVDKTITLN
ncbi:SusE domain-containing protein [Flavobacterium frigoris]|uniref:SusE outer membrane protein n=1 Tax=Flavobacterium frigoris TaxID=229204 RepID=A0A1H9DM87_FLAFI|nr:SusE domain-containing protein [Flavobacterium frigoris]SEQ14612.1 SusE outer membrane protein [Flavobacterium frigoris]